MVYIFILFAFVDRFHLLNAYKYILIEISKFDLRTQETPTADNV